VLFIPFCFCIIIFQHVHYSSSISETFNIKSLKSSHLKSNMTIYIFINQKLRTKQEKHALMSCPIISCSQGECCITLHHCWGRERERCKKSDWGAMKCMSMYIAKRVQWKEPYEIRHWWKGCIISLQKTSHCFSAPLYLLSRGILFVLICTMT
jgi:hypothetical protein